MKWKVICAVPWFFLLGWILSADFAGLEPALVVILTIILNLAAAPMSFAALGIVALVEHLFGLAIVPKLGEFSLSVALIWWAGACGLFYLQWSYLAPKLWAAIAGLRVRRS